MTGRVAGLRRHRSIKVALYPDEHAAIASRAAAHGVSMASFIRTASLGERPGSVSASTEADAWWDAIPPSRRGQVHGWLTKPAPGPDGADLGMDPLYQEDSTCA